MQTTPLNIRVPRETLEKIALATKKTGLTQADVMRTALELGLEELKHVSKSPLERIKDEVNQAKAKRSESSKPPHPQNKRQAS